MQIGVFTKAIDLLICSQLNDLKLTSQVVHIKCTLNVSILPRTLPFQISVLKTLLRHVLQTLLRHHSVSRVLNVPHSFSIEIISPATTSSD
jgi:hypothetical protein